MDSIKSRAIVLHVTKYTESRLIVDLLTRQHGRISVGVNVGSKSRGNGKRSFFQPLNIIYVVGRLQRAGGIASLSEVSMAEVYDSIPVSGAKMSLAFFIAEFLLYATRDVQSDVSLYDYIERSILWLDYTDKGFANFHIMFMVHLSRLLGFYPDMESFSDGFYFDMREGTFSSLAPLHPDFLQPSDAAIMQQIMRMDAANLHLFHFTREERNRITDLMLHFYHLHIPSFGDMRSLSVLREL